MDFSEEEKTKRRLTEEDENIILNPEFEEGLSNWSARGCRILLLDAMREGEAHGTHFASATDRTQSWNGIQQEITGRVQRKRAYEVTALVRSFGTSSPCDMRATLWVQNLTGREQYIGIATVQASDKAWVQLRGKFLINGVISKAVIYLEGPPPGTDVLLSNLTVKHAEKLPPSTPPDTDNVIYGANIISNSSLNDNLNGWVPLGTCTLEVANGSPLLLPPMAEESLGNHEALSGNYILVSNRSQTWMGPSQTITERLKLHVTYQVSAWVRIGSDKNGPQNINVALGIDGQWVNGGQVEVADTRWYEIGGSFRIEKKPSKVVVYVQGPSPGLDFMLAALQIFPVDRKGRFKHLKVHTNKVRKRDVILKITDSNSGELNGGETIVSVEQVKNSFPIGSSISRSAIDNDEFVEFFVRNFDWAVFENELKWYWTEPQQGIFNYADADELLQFCDKHKIDARGHCIFWEAESAVQPWVKSLSPSELAAAVRSRLTGLMSRYRGRFKHYDVNNEMLHGSFFQSRLGSDARAGMFRSAGQSDASAQLFVNDYHIEDAADAGSSPEKYVQQILGLAEAGAPVAGIGVQGHTDAPVGAIVSRALDGLGVLGLPIWFTELDVSAQNECVRAEDLEVMLREAYAHPAVEGVLLWGFWELIMSRENGHLVGAEGDLNEAGKRFLELKQEWLSRARGSADDRGEFRFRGFLGDYRADVLAFGKKTTRFFSVAKGDGPSIVSISLPAGE